MPVLDLFLTVIGFVVFVAWIALVIWVLADILRSWDLSGWAKALWTLAVVFVPLLGVFIYLVVRGKTMSARGERWAFGEDIAP